MVMVLHRAQHYRPGTYSGGYGDTSAHRHSSAGAQDRGTVGSRSSMDGRCPWSASIATSWRFGGHSTQASGRPGVSRFARGLDRADASIQRLGRGAARPPIHSRGRAGGAGMAALRSCTGSRPAAASALPSSTAGSMPPIPTSGQIVGQPDFLVGGPTPSEGHGTAVAGIIAARAHKGSGSRGSRRCASSWPCALAGRRRPTDPVRKLRPCPSSSISRSIKTPKSST